MPGPIEDRVCTLTREEPGSACVNQSDRTNAIPRRPEATCNLPGHEPTERIACEMDNVVARSRATDLRDSRIGNCIKRRVGLEHRGFGRIFDGHETKPGPQLGAH